MVLSEEHQKLQDRPPVIIKQEDNKSALLEDVSTCGRSAG